LTETEVSTTIINSQKESKSPGEDGFTADIIKKLHSIKKTFLPKLYNKCLQISVFPKKWENKCNKSD
jgi:hypothetical protein